MDTEKSFGNRFVEMAETGAIGRALGNAGFGSQFCCDKNESGEADIVDAPVESGSLYKQPNNSENRINTKAENDVEINVSLTESEEEPDLPFETGASAISSAGQPDSGTAAANKTNAPAGLLVNSLNPASQNNQTENHSAPNTAKYNKSTPVAEIYRVMTLEEAKNCFVDVGDFKGKLLSQVAAERPDKIAWYVNTYSGPNNILRAAAKILLEIATNEKLAG